MQKFRFPFLIAFLALILLLAGTVGVLARGGGGGGFSSGHTSSSSSSASGLSSSSGGWGTSSRSSSTPSSSPRSSTSNGGWGSSTSAASTKPSGRVDAAAAAQAKQNGTAFTSRSSAASSFQASHASSYPTTFSSQPTTRPTYIPSTTTVNGRPYNVIYDPYHRGYGYMGPLGWVGYSPLMDAVMLDMLMRQNHYYYGPQPYPVHRGIGLFGWLIIGLLCFGIVALVVRAGR